MQYVLEREEREREREREREERERGEREERERERRERERGGERERERERERRERERGEREREYLAESDVTPIWNGSQIFFQLVQNVYMCMIYQMSSKIFDITGAWPREDKVFKLSSALTLNALIGKVILQIILNLRFPIFTSLFLQHHQNDCIQTSGPFWWHVLQSWLESGYIYVYRSSYLQAHSV